MRLALILMLGLLSPLLMLGQNPFDEAASKREAARQKAFDRGQKTALPAAEKREKIAKQKETAQNAQRSAKGEPIKQGAPSSHIYNRVMEMRRHVNQSENVLSNANDTFVNHPAATEMYDKETERLYPDIKRPDSAFALRHAAISEWIAVRQPPLAKDSRRKLLIAHMVSLEQTGQLHEDDHHIGLNITTMPPKHQGPDFLKRSTFEIIVDEANARLPDGVTGTFTAGAFGGSDRITWQHEGLHQFISIPQASKGLSLLPDGSEKKYMRQQTLNQGWRFTFLP